MTRPMLAAPAAIALLGSVPMHRHHGNPEDLDSYVAKMEDPSRAEWQKPDEVLRVLAPRRGQVVCDIGAGPGYFTFPVARAVGEAGHVYAVDVEPRILEALRKRLRKSRLRNVTPVLALEDDPLVPTASCDLILVVDTYHHFPDGPAYLRRLARSLRPGGRLVNIDFHKRELPVGPPPEHKLTREEFLALADAAGLALVEEHPFLPYQYFLVLAPRRT
ncbi:MAG: methyltransferase domain-containing protein [Deltaproteobacteria bacterium]|nr:MAG: methyltransferase domain-containing protein [Deltaproteobacteria bacterium]